MGCNMKLEKYFLIGLVIMLVITAFMPQHIVLGDGASDTLQITFDPSGAVNGNVSPESYDFGGITFETNETSTAQFTLYNNGTIPMSAVARQNQTTDTGDMTCNGAGGALAQNEYSINITDGTVSNDGDYINDVGDSTIESSLDGAGSTETFYLMLHLGDGSADHAAQTTQINWTFAAV